MSSEEQQLFNNAANNLQFVAAAVRNNANDIGGIPSNINNVQEADRESCLLAAIDQNQKRNAVPLNIQYHNHVAQQNDQVSTQQTQPKPN